MTSQNQTVGAGAYGASAPTIHTIGLADLKDALGKGFADFEAMPTHLAFLCLIYPLLPNSLAGLRAWTTGGC